MQQTAKTFDFSGNPNSNLSVQFVYQGLNRQLSTNRTLFDNVFLDLAPEIGTPRGQKVHRCDDFWPMKPTFLENHPTNCFHRGLNRPISICIKPFGSKKNWFFSLNWNFDRQKMPKSAIVDEFLHKQTRFSAEIPTELLSRSDSSAFNL